MLKKGFTLLEMLIVVAIIGALILIFSQNGKNYFSEAELKRMQGTAKSLETGIASYYTTHKTFPTSNSYNTNDITPEVGSIINYELQKRGSTKEYTDLTYYEVDNNKISSIIRSKNTDSYFFSTEEPIEGMVFSKKIKSGASNKEFSGLYSIDVNNLPTPFHISTAGLIRYWHYTQGLSTSSWENIAPSTKNNYAMCLSGSSCQYNSTIHPDGVGFTAPVGTIIVDEVDIPSNNFTIEIGYTNYNTNTFGLFMSDAFQEDVALMIAPNSNEAYSANHTYNVSTTPNQFHVSTLVFTNNSESYYQDGVKIGTNSISPTTLTELLNLGNEFGDPLLAGSIHFFRIYDRSLTDSEVISNHGTPLMEKGL